MVCRKMFMVPYTIDPLMDLKKENKAQNNKIQEIFFAKYSIAFFKSVHIVL